MISRLVLRALDDVAPERRRLWAARLLVWCLAGEAVSHVLLVVLGQSSFFQQVLMAISWIAISITCCDVLATSDVRAEVDTAEGGVTNAD